MLNVPTHNPSHSHLQIIYERHITTSPTQHPPIICMPRRTLCVIDCPGTIGLTPNPCLLQPRRDRQIKPPLRTSITFKSPTIRTAPPYYPATCKLTPTQPPRDFITAPPNPLHPFIRPSTSTPSPEIPTPSTNDIRQASVPPDPQFRHPLLPPPRMDRAINAKPLVAVSAPRKTSIAELAEREVRWR